MRALYYMKYSEHITTLGYGYNTPCVVDTHICCSEMEGAMFYSRDDQPELGLQRRYLYLRSMCPEMLLFNGRLWSYMSWETYS